MNPNQKEKLKELRAKLESLQNPPVDISQFFINDELAKISEQLRANPTIKALQKFNGDLQKLQTQVSKLDLDLTPIQTEIQKVQKELKQGDKDLLQEFETRLRNLPQPDFTPQLEALRTEFDTRIKALPVDDDSALEADLENIKGQLQAMVLSNEAEDKLDKDELEKTLTKLRVELMNRINNIGGGSMNRQILFNSVDRLTRYTDINFKPGTNVTFTVANDDTNKRVNLTIAASGGGGGSGITRSVNSIAISTAADNAAITDYVYLCNGTLTVTLPDAASNSNLYTIKNIGTGTVTIATTGGQTIDGDTTIIMPVRYTSVDLISDGTSAWEVT